MGIGLESTPGWNDVFGPVDAPARQLWAMGFRLAMFASCLGGPREPEFCVENSKLSGAGVYAFVYVGGGVFRIGETGDFWKRMQVYKRHTQHRPLRREITALIDERRAVPVDEWCFSQFVYVLFLPEQEIRSSTLKLTIGGVCWPNLGVSRFVLEQILIGVYAPPWNKKGTGTEVRVPPRIGRRTRRPTA